MEYFTGEACGLFIVVVAEVDSRARKKTKNYLLFFPKQMFTYNECHGSVTPLQL